MPLAPNVKQQQRTPEDLTERETQDWEDRVIVGLQNISLPVVSEYTNSTNTTVSTAAQLEMIRRLVPRHDEMPEPFVPTYIPSIPYITEAKPVTNTPPSDLWPPVYLEFSMSKNAYVLRLPGNVTRSVELPSTLNTQLNALRAAAVTASKE